MVPYSDPPFGCHPRRRGSRRTRGRARPGRLPGLLAAALLLASLAGLAGCDLAARNEVALLETDHGIIVVEFLPRAAPNHVKHFKELARKGVYRNVLFHRVVPGFIVQTGDPTTKDPATPRSEYGKGGVGTTLEAELSDEPHKRGTVSMARTRRGPDTASSQFFICLDALPHLDGEYTVFGRVVDGMDVVDRIAEVERDVRNAPKRPVRLQEVRIVHRNDVPEILAAQAVEEADSDSTAGEPQEVDVP